uniref:Uncharacterized protein n=1 Tax=Glossina austeni TaxID=7395 RepID=A0A1A9UPS5_GLOAU
MSSSSLSAHNYVVIMARTIYFLHFTMSSSLSAYDSIVITAPMNFKTDTMREVTGYRPFTSCLIIAALFPSPFFPVGRKTKERNAFFDIDTLIPRYGRCQWLSTVACPSVLNATTATQKLLLKSYLRYTSILSTREVY